MHVHFLTFEEKVFIMYWYEWHAYGMEVHTYKYTYSIISCTRVETFHGIHNFLNRYVP
jgi:hypothetical protein